MSLWLREMGSQPTRLAALLRWDCAETFRTLRNRDGALMACLRARGPDQHTALGSELIVQADQLNNVWRRLDGAWVLQSEARRQEVCQYPVARWPDPVSQLLDEERRDYFLTPGTHWETVTTLTLIWKGARAQGHSGLKRMLYADLPPDETTSDVPRFEEDVRRLRGLLGECCEEVTWLEQQDVLRYLHSTISWKDHPIDWPERAAYLGHWLADTDLERVYVLPSLLRWPKLGEQYLRCVGVRRYPQTSHPGMFDILDDLPLPYRACERWRPLSRQQAIQEARRYGGGYWSQRQDGTRVNATAIALAKQASDFQQGVEQHEWSGGYDTQTVVTWGHTFAEATDRAEQIERVLNAVGCVAKIETLNTMSAWLGTLPGETLRNTRIPLLHSRNLAHKGPWQAQTRGARWNSHLGGPPLLTVTGRTGAPIGLDTYEDDLGHFFIVGPSGAGKSFLFAMMAMATRKYGGDMYLFDKDQSMRCPTYAMGGRWHNLKAELEQLARSGGTLEDVLAQGPFIRWPLPEGRWHCFETDGIEKSPDLIPKFLGPICADIERRMQGQHVGIFFDEFWRFLTLPFFVEKAKDWLLTMRKKNGMVGFSTPNIAHILHNAIGTDIFQSCPTRFFLANRHAIEGNAEGGTKKQYLDLGQTERDIEIIARLIPKRQYYYDGPLGKFVFELNAGAVARAYAGSSRKADLAAMDRLYRGDSRQFNPAWLRWKGLHEAAERLETLYVMEDEACDDGREHEHDALPTDLAS
jgi:type IV secretory pathway VirB4 component